MNVVSIVEGDGEVLALPVLLRRIAAWKTPDRQVNIATPIRVRRDRFLNREDEFQRFLLLASAKCGLHGWILVLLDADDDCPAELGRQLLQRAASCVGHRRVSVVLAKREYEAWFIAAAQSLNGYRGFSHDAQNSVDAEVPRDAKGWLRQRIAGGAYGETTDQPAFSAQISLAQAYDGSRSFRKLCAEWEKEVI